MSTAEVTRQVTVLGSVSYDTYVGLRDAPANRGLRMAYHDGVLEIMSPEFLHDNGARRLYVVVLAYCETFSVPCTPAGSTTFRAGLPGQLEGNGKEPDESFYFRDAAVAIRGKSSLDLAIDPPPSLWVEVDNWGSSDTKLPLYAGLKVPEVWRYRARKETLWIGRLNETGDGYEEAAASVALPGLTPAMVLEMLSAENTWDVVAWRRFLEHDWFPRHRQELAGGV